MKCEVFAAESRADAAAGKLRRVSLELPEFDIGKMRQAYYQEKKTLRQGFDQFQTRWEAEWKMLPQPQAGVIRWSREELAQDFIPLFPEEEQMVRQALEEQCQEAWAAVWTIGPVLEKTAHGEVHSSALQAMFLDVAGSLLMGSVRSALHSFVAEQGMEVLGEQIPEISREDLRLRVIAEPWMSAPVGPSVELNTSGVLYPLKSQCAMFFVGQRDEHAKVRLNEIPCSHCKGSKCLYRQFGGCHLPLDRQPEKEKRGH